MRLAREIKSSNFLLNIYHVNTKMFLGHGFCILDIKSGVVVWYFDDDDDDDTFIKVSKL